MGMGSMGLAIAGVAVGGALRTKESTDMAKIEKPPFIL
jgi:hypothetical protein